MSTKKIIEKNLERAAEDMAAQEPPPVVQAEDGDTELARALRRVEKGDLKEARRTRNGALVETR